MDLIASDIRHYYQGRVVLDGVSLAAASGEIVALLGPSGCGKSTLLRILGGLERPDSGRVETAGAAPAESFNPLTYVFQDFALVPWRTVAGNVALPLEHHRMAAEARRARVADALARVGLADFSEAYPRQLSGGMKQRTALARALAVDPAVLLMDEPLSALDAQTRELLMDDLVRLWRETRFTAVYVTHNLAEAVRLGHRVVVLSRRPGRVRAVVDVPVALADRREGMPELVEAREAIWRLIRDEVVAADREVSRG